MLRWEVLPETHHIYLVPGFFGFVNFGRLVYFSHVHEILDLELHRRGVRAEIHRARVSPTASIRKRAAELATTIAATAPPDGPIHIIGHSTGGLDARLLVTPNVDLGDGGLDVEALASRVRSVVTVNAPHRGTPLATFFNGLLGQKLLALLSVVTATILREGRLPMSVVARIGSVVARLSVPGTAADAALSALHAELIGRLPSEEQDLFTEFFHQLSTDQALIPQLTPDGIDLFNATATDRPGVRYGSVIARGKAPSVRGHLSLRRPYDQATYSFYHFLHRRTADVPGTWDPGADAETVRELARRFGSPVARRDSDGVVPTLSQLWGQLLYAAEGDHLDVIGHFGDEHHRPPHHDWVVTRSGFSRSQFERLWTAVVDFLLRDRSPGATTPG